MFRQNSWEEGSTSESRAEPWTSPSEATTAEWRAPAPGRPTGWATGLVPLHFTIRWYIRISHTTDSTTERAKINIGERVIQEGIQLVCKKFFQPLHVLYEILAEPTTGVYWGYPSLYSFHFNENLENFCQVSDRSVLRRYLGSRG